MAEYQGSVLGVVSLVQRAPDNPLELRGQLEGLGEGLYRLRLLGGDCQQQVWINIIIIIIIAMIIISNVSIVFIININNYHHPHTIDQLHHQEGDSDGELLSEIIGSDGNSSSYISSEEWGLTLYPGSRTQVHTHTYVQKKPQT